VIIIKEKGKVMQTIISLISLIIYIWLIVWTVKDAKSRGGNALLWGIIVFLFNIIGFIIYLLVGRKASPGAGGGE